MEQLMKDIDTENLIPNISTNDITAIQSLQSENDLSIISLNIRSITKNFDEFLVLMDSLKIDFDIVILTECWLNNTYTPKEIKNYISIQTELHYNQNSGIVVYAKDNLNITSLEVTITQGNCLKIVIDKILSVIAIYRSPSDNNILPFLHELRHIIATVNEQDVIIIGDININILDRNRHPQADNYLDLLTELKFRPTITVATRINENSQSCIDHIMLKSRRNARAAVFETTITDHYTTLLFLEHRTHNTTQHKKQKNSIRSINFELLKNNLAQETWHSTLNTLDINLATQNFITTLQAHINTSTQIRLLKHKQIALKNWITPGILRSIHKRNKLHQQVKRFPLNNALKNYYRKYKNICTKLIRISKIDYYKTEINRNSGNTQEIWKTIRNITNTSTQKTQLINTIATNTPDLIIDAIKDPEIAANAFNKHFTDVGTRLATQILDRLNVSEEILANNTDPSVNLTHSIFLTPVTNREVAELIQNLKTKNSPGPDKITSDMLKKINESIIIPLVYIFNLSISQGQVPTHFKNAIICPIYKAGDKTDLSNYRPISLLNTIGKVLEQAVKRRLTNYLEQNNILSNNQYGFRHGRSTDDAIIYLTRQIVTDVDQHKKSLAIFLDLAKAFDTVSHKILLRKLHNLGIRGVALEWFRSYLLSRKQVSKVNGVVSEEQTITFGVPQGTVLGPILFLIYMNDLCNLDIDGSIVSFADDTVLYFSAETWCDTHAKAAKGITQVHDWLTNNLLTLNTDKTKYMTFSPTTYGQPDDLNLTIHQCRQNRQACSCNPLKKAEHYKYLGVTIDNRLKWTIHIQNLTSRLRKLIYIFLSLRNILNRQLMKSVYFALCQSVLSYGIAAWGGTYKTILVPLKNTLKLLIRIILKKPPLFPSKELFKEFTVLQLEQLYTRTILSFYHRHPEIQNPIEHSYRTRSQDDQSVKIPKMSKTFGQKHMVFLAPKLFNLLPPELKAINTYQNKTFKSKLTDWLLKDENLDCIKRIFSQDFS